MHSMSDYPVRYKLAIAPSASRPPPHTHGRPLKVVPSQQRVKTGDLYLSHQLDSDVVSVKTRHGFMSNKLNFRDFLPRFACAVLQYLLISAEISSSALRVSSSLFIGQLSLNFTMRIA
jgi:hypothetical protein